MIGQAHLVLVTVSRPCAGHVCLFCMPALTFLFVLCGSQILIEDAL